MNTVEDTNHPNDVFLNVLASCRRSVDRFNEVLNSALDDVEAEKECSRCEKRRPFTEFGVMSAGTDGHQAWCKVCMNAYNRGYNQTEKGKEVQKRSNEKYREDELHRWEHKAHNAVRTAVKAGVLPHISERICEDCGEQAQIYHHESYEEARWLEVTPLCHSCHRARDPKEILK